MAITTTDTVGPTTIIARFHLSVDLLRVRTIDILHKFMRLLMNCEKPLGEFLRASADPREAVAKTMRWAFFLEMRQGYR